MNNMETILDKIVAILAKFPSGWDGKKSILEMRAKGYPHWRQNEWIGFYFQYLCDGYLPSAGMKIPGSKFGRAEFDGCLQIDWDFKAHPIFDKNGKIAHKLIVNDMVAVIESIKLHGKTGLIVAQGEATFDDELMSFRTWHSNLKGGLSDYSKENISRGARKRLYKTSFLLKRIDIYILSEKDLVNQGTFQKGMRNSNGKPRREKLQIDLSTLVPSKTVIIRA